jgi:hypothetical protein
MDAKNFWHLNSHKYETYWVTSNDIISFKAEDLWRYMNDFLEQSHKHIVMQAEGSDVSEGATGASSAAGKGVCDGCGNYNIHCTCWQNSKDDFMQQFK